MEKRAIALWYDENQNKYRKYAECISELLIKLLETKGIAYHSITYRLKEKESYLKKCETKQYDDPISKVMDLAGIRVIAYTTEDVKKINELIKANFCVDMVNSVNKAEQLNRDRVGYLSVHFVASLNDQRAHLAEYSQFDGLKCEIQVRTMLQHAWAEIEHDRSYKFSGVLPETIDRRFHLIAGVLEMMDSEFQRLSDEIDEYSKNVKEKTQKGNLNISIDSSSLLEFLSQKVNSPRIEKSFNNHDEKIISELSSFGINTLEQLSKIMTESFCRSCEEFANAYYYNYIALLRDVMICTDTHKYFEKAWQGHWTIYDKESYSFWKKYGADMKIIESNVTIDEDIDDNSSAFCLDSDGD